MKTRITRTATMWTIGTSLLVAAAFAATGCNAEPRDGASGPAATGRAAASEPAPEKVPTVCTGCVTEERLGQTVAVEAGVSQQCPASGCWLRLKDNAGEVMVDLAPKKLILTEQRVGERAKVTGKVVKKGGRIWLEAEKVEFSPAEKNDPAPADKK
jgi:hypothetical protein